MIDVNDYVCRLTDDDKKKKKSWTAKHYCLVRKDEDISCITGACVTRWDVLKELPYVLLKVFFFSLFFRYTTENEYQENIVFGQLGWVLTLTDTLLYLVSLCVSYNLNCYSLFSFTFSTVTFLLWFLLKSEGLCIGH